MNIYKAAKLITLKYKIKGLAESGLKTNRLIKLTTGKKRDGHWTMKRIIGEEARYNLIAYGLLRGINYKLIEPTTSQAKLSQFDFGYLAQICQRHCMHSDMHKFSPVNLKKIMVNK